MIKTYENSAGSKGKAGGVNRRLICSSIFGALIYKIRVKSS